MRTVAMLGAALAAVALSVGSASGAGTRSAKEGGTFKVVAPGDFFPGIDPAIVGIDVDLLRPACGSLMAYPDEPLPSGLQLAPELATSEPIISEDGRTYTFTIRRDARFSTGAPVTARDLAHSLERVLTPAVQSGVAGHFENIAGAQEMLAGKATTLRGAVARGRILTLKLVKRVPDLPARMTELCAVPASLPVDPEGARAPLPSAAPYYVADYVIGERVVLERNTFYRGRRPHRVDRIDVDLGGDPSAALQGVESGAIDHVWGTPSELNAKLPELAQRYGINKSRFFILPSLAGRMFFLNTSRPLFRNNARLRRALNFAVDRRALIREFGSLAATPTDQFLPPLMPGFRDRKIYPLERPDLPKARALAAGRTRAGKGVLYIRTSALDVAAAQVLRKSLRAIGLELEIKQFPFGVFFEKAATPGEPFDIILLGWQAAYKDPREFLRLFDGREPNYSRFNSTTFNRLLDQAGNLSGAARYRAYGKLDVQLARDVAPAIPYAVFTAWTLVSKRTGCVVVNPFLDLTAVCLK